MLALASCNSPSYQPVSPTTLTTNPIVTVVGRVLDAQANRGIEGTVLVWDVLEAPRSTTRV
jgi:hypothetical protein